MELRKISQEELNKIIENHQHWLKKDCEGWEKMKANLRRVDLNCTYLSYADLREADLSYADLRNADLTYANLSYAILRGVDLRNADLTYANLSYADLRRVDLSYSILSYAILRNADLSEADLSYTTLRRTNLRNADLREANLRRANLRNADLSGVNYNHLTSFFATQCPEEGSFIGYKKSGNKIVKLRIEEDSKRSSATSRKCRASKVTVLSITSIDGENEFQKTENTGEYSFTYEVGKTYEIDNFDDNRWNECSTGIHFFITREEAVRY